MNTEYQKKIIARIQAHSEMAESGFQDSSLPPYAYTELCRFLNTGRVKSGKEKRV